jgi:hypothetical protein
VEQNAALLFWSASERAFRQRTFLHCAAEQDWPRVIDALMASGQMNVDVPDRFGASPLMMALSVRSHASARHLLTTYHASVDIVTENNVCALLLVQSEQLAFELAAAVTNDVLFQNAGILLHAVSVGMERFVDFLLTKKGMATSNTFRAVCSKGMVALANRIVAVGGIDLNAINDVPPHRTALMAAVERTDISILHYLLSLGDAVDVNKVVGPWNIHVLDLLRDVNITDMYRERQVYRECMAKLMSRVDVALAKQHRNRLFHLVNADCVDAVQILLERGCIDDEFVRQWYNKNSESVQSTPILLCARSRPMMELLIAHGANAALAERPVRFVHQQLAKLSALCSARQFDIAEFLLNTWNEFQFDQHLITVEQPPSCSIDLLRLLLRRTTDPAFLCFALFRSISVALVHGVVAVFERARELDVCLRIDLERLRKAFAFEVASNSASVDILKAMWAHTPHWPFDKIFDSFVHANNYDAVAFLLMRTNVDASRHTLSLDRLLDDTNGTNVFNMVKLVLESGMEVDVDKCLGSMRYMVQREDLVIIVLTHVKLSERRRLVQCLTSVAVQRNALTTLQYLLQTQRRYLNLDKGPYLPFGPQVPPLFHARSVETVHLLVDAGANVNQRVRRTWHNYETPLSNALREHRDTDVISALIRRGAQVNDACLWNAICRYDDGVPSATQVMQVILNEASDQLTTSMVRCILPLCWRANDPTRKLLVDWQNARGAKRRKHH